MANRFHLHLVRHAQSANNALPEPERVEDPPITAHGSRQAELLAERFKDEPVTCLLTSGFLRAVQTTVPLAKALNQRPMIWTELHEVGGCYRGYRAGELEGRPGMNRETLASQFPEFHVPSDIDELGWWKSEPFESHDRARIRAQRQATRLLDEFRDSAANVVCVIHADIKALLLEYLLESEFRSYAAADLVNTGVTTLSITAGSIEVVEFNNARHLPNELVTS